MNDRSTEKITEIIRQLICLKKGKGTMKGRRCVAVFCMTAMLLSVNEMGAGSWKQGELVAAAEDSVWKEVPENFVFSSGVGAWATELQVEDDGSFTGVYHDSEMGDTGDGYPNGTVYFCNFSGKFTEPLRFDKCMYEMDLEELNIEGTEGDSYIENGVRYVCSEPYGISGGTQFTLYTPGQPYELMSEDFIWWVRSIYGNEDTDYLTCYAICNEGTQDGFVAYDNPQADSNDDEYIFPNSDKEYLDQQDIAYMTSEGIQQAVNEIYARHGRVFQKADVAAYFASKSWYHPVQGKTDDQIVAEFNSYEKANVDFLAKYL